MRFTDPTRLLKQSPRCDMQEHLLEILCMREEADTAELARIAKLTSTNASTMLRRMQQQRLVVKTSGYKTGPFGYAAKWQLREAYERRQLAK